MLLETAGWTLVQLKSQLLETVSWTEVEVCQTSINWSSDDQAGLPALTTVVRQGPASAGRHSVGGFYVKPVPPGQA